MQDQKTRFTRKIGNTELVAQLKEDELYIRCTLFLQGKKAERFSSNVTLDTIEQSMALYFVDLESLFAYLESSETLDITDGSTIRMTIQQSLISGKTKKRQWTLYLVQEIIPDQQYEQYSQTREKDLLEEIKNLKEDYKLLKAENKSLRARIQELEQFERENYALKQKIQYLQSLKAQEKSPVKRKLQNVCLEENSYSKIADKIRSIDVFVDQLQLKVIVQMQKIILAQTHPDHILVKISFIFSNVKIWQQFRCKSQFYLGEIFVESFERAKKSRGTQKDCDQARSPTFLKLMLRWLDYLKSLKVIVLQGCHIKKNNWTTRVKQNINVFVENSSQ